MAQKRALSDEQIVEIFRLKSEGATFDEIARKYGVTYTSIRDILHRKWYKDVQVPDLKIEIVWGGRKGRRPANRMLTDDQVREIRRMAREGKAFTAIAQARGLHATTVSYVVRRKTYKDVKDDFAPGD